MKRKLIILLFIFTLTGCVDFSVKEMEATDFVDLVVNDSHKMINHSSNGYNYYLPSGVKVVKVSGSNEVLYTKQNHMYLYVDLIGYKNDVLPEYEYNSNLYYSKDLSNKENVGYIEIKKVNKQYLVKVVYNFASIEACVYKEEIDNILVDMAYIVTSIEYNDIIINSLINGEEFDFSINEYQIFKPVDQNFYLEGGADSVIDTSRAIFDPDFIDLELSE